MRDVLAVCAAVAVLLAAPAAQTLSPAPQNAEHLWYDHARRQLMLLAASRERGRVDLWDRAGGGWRLVEVSAAPPARELSGAAYDSTRRVLVFHGGMGLASRDQRHRDTWELKDAAWRRAADAPGPRDHHALAYDAARRRTVLYGGVADDDTLATATWEWDGAAWSEVAREGPGGRAHFPLAYDDGRREVVLFGGMGEGYQYHQDTWAWNGTAWRKRGDGGPPARSHHRMAFHRKAGVVVLFGGLERGNVRRALGDTWVWDGTSWTEVTGPGPAARSGQIMGYDEGRERVILLGGGAFDGRASVRHDDFWEFDGRAWTRPEAAPSASRVRSPEHASRVSAPTAAASSGRP